MVKLTKGWMRLLVAVSVLWLLVVAGVVFGEYLAHNPEDQSWNRSVVPQFYFWTWADPSTADLLSPRQFEPNLPRIFAALLGPLPMFWIVGWLIAWVSEGFRSK